MIEFEETVPTFVQHHSQWVNAIKGVYDKHNVLNREQFSKACWAANFNLANFLSQIDISADEVRRYLVVDRDAGTYNYGNMLLFSIMMTQDDSEGIDTKVNTLTTVLANGVGSISKKQFESAVTFLLSLACIILPQGARQSSSENSTKIGKYIHSLSGTISPSVLTLSKLVFGGMTDISKEDFKRKIMTIKEGPSILNSRKARSFALKKYEMTKRLKELNINEDFSPIKETNT